MKPKKDEPTSTAELRRRAAQTLRDRSNEGGDPVDGPSSSELVHELRVHQIELEMQNEELLASRADLETALAQYEELYDFAPVGYFTLGRDGTIRRANLTGARMLGLERSKLLERRFALFVAVADRLTFDAVLTSAFETVEPVSCEVLLAPPGNTASPSRYLQLTFAAGSTEGDRRVAAVDVTERRWTEEQLRTAHKMEGIGRLAGGIAHDFNNILAVILGHTEFALETPGISAQLSAEINEQKLAAERAVALTRQLLAFTRRQMPKRRVIDVNELVRSLVKMLERLLGANVTLLMALAPDLGNVEADSVQLEQVIMNLAVNARDAMPNGGKLTICTDNVIIDKGRSGKYAAATSLVLISVGDTGAGMDEATKARAFEPFFTTKAKERGTGFGLSTVYGIVTEYGGDVTLRSEVGKGTTFEVHLPATTLPVEPEAAAAPHSALQLHARGNETILVVEDEATVRRIAERLLASVGYTVLTAESGEIALQICAAHEGKIHLMLSDVIMPTMSGVELARRVKMLHPQIRVLHMSGYADDVTDGQGVFDRDRLIAKPFTMRALREKVRQVLDGPA